MRVNIHSTLPCIAALRWRQRGLCRDPTVSIAVEIDFMREANGSLNIGKIDPSGLEQRADLSEGAPLSAVPGTRAALPALPSPFDPTALLSMPRIGDLSAMTTSAPV